METEVRTSDDTLRFGAAMLALAIAGEAIFFLPFVIARVFRPTLLDVFGVTNLELGIAFSIYGTVAMLSYFPGGLIADRFSPRVLMSVSLVATSLGGLLFATIPSTNTLNWLYGFWGLTTILLFWAPLITATRQQGGTVLQGTAFGLLDAGRGLVAAIGGMIAVSVFSLSLPDSILPDSLDNVTPAQRLAAFQNVILGFAGATAAAACLIWFHLPTPASQPVSTPPRSTDLKSSQPGKHRRWRESVDRLRSVSKLPTVWAQAVLVLCAYVCYKGLDDVSLYAKEVMGFDEVAAASMGVFSMWMRPPAALLAGIIADRWRVSSLMVVAFCVVAGGSFFIAMGWAAVSPISIFYLTFASTSAAIFALRGLYFAIMQEGKIPAALTGTAVGIASAIGYAPDIFMGPLMGELLDRSPGPTGHHHVFAVVGAFAILGAIATIVLNRAANRDRHPDFR